MDSSAATALPAIQLITSTSKVSDRLRPINNIKHPSRFAEIIAGIARTRKVLILSGDAALSGTGIQPLDDIVPQLSPSRSITYRSFIREATLRPEEFPTSRLVTFNQVMTHRRIAARDAKGSMFLDYLGKLCQENKLAKCLTTSIDGLEARSSPEVAPRVVTLYGDNQFVRCLDPNCNGLTEAETTAMDDRFLTEEIILCSVCCSRNQNQGRVRRHGTSEPRALRPCVQKRCGLSFVQVEIPIDDDGDQGDEYVDEPDLAPKGGNGKASGSQKGTSLAGSGGEVPNGSKPKSRAPRKKREPQVKFTPPDPTKLAGYDEGCHLFLIVGAPPKDPDLLDVVRDLASSVHERDGAVVYIDPAPLHGTSQHDHIDIHLQGDIQETLGDILLQMRRRLGPSEHMDEELGSDVDLWFEFAPPPTPVCQLIQNDIPVRQTEKEASYGGDVCAHCQCGITEYLAKCTQCHLNFCYRRVQDEGNECDDSDTEEADLGGIGNNIGAPGILPPVNPSKEGPTNAEPDRFPFHEACIVFNMFSPSSSRPTLTEATRSFVCPECWKHKESGLYPHYLRPPPRDSIELNGDQWPRLVLVVYYLEQFWPQTKHLIALTTGYWRQLGWEFLAQPVKLQQLQEREDPFVNLKWEAGTYQVIAVYITHGLTGEQGYQLNNSKTLRPAELLAQSLPIAKTALDGASFSSVFLFACGHPMYHPGMVADLSDWVDMECNPGLLIACLNKKLSPTYMFNLFTKVTKTLAEQPDNAHAAIQLSWMRDSLAPSHSDLLCVARNRPAEAWLYAPFQSRPLGKALPSLLSVCPCSAQQTNPDGTLQDKRRRKIWKVEHDGKPGSKLQDVKVKAICRACRQAWPLPQDPLRGRLIRVNGVYGAVVPYFG
ncbi:hypothetical protein FRC11_014257 [Ceratobasidium sp. 423]|nr:hypothetical protein FRC11_014257 [Ceratobasidium sp. 423]